MDVKRHAGTGMIILAIALAVAVSTSSAGGLGHGNHKHSQSGPYPVPVCDPCVPPPWTVFEADKEFENLQIHVTGPGFNILEIYFKRTAASSSHAPKSSSSAGASSLPSLLLRWLCVLFCGASSTADAASPVPPADRFFVDPIDGASCLYANKSLALCQPMSGARSQCVTALTRTRSRSTDGVPATRRSCTALTPWSLDTRSTSAGSPRRSLRSLAAAAMVSPRHSLCASGPTPQETGAGRTSFIWGNPNSVNSSIGTALRARLNAVDATSRGCQLLFLHEQYCSWFVP